MKDVDLEIITADFEQFRNGNYIGYTPISCVGKFYSKDKSISVETEQLRGLSIFRMFENQRAKDFKACYMLYQKRLEKKGAEKILQEITELCQKNFVIGIFYCIFCLKICLKIFPFKRKKELIIRNRKNIGKRIFINPEDILN